jgi:hypothetical protein
MDSPTRATNIPLGATTFIDNQLSINAHLGLSYAGKYTNDTFEGVFKTRWYGNTMTLARQNETIKPLNRPQTPKAPFITTEEVSFQNIN